MRRFGLMALTEEGILRQPNIDSVVWYLVATLMQVNNKRSILGKEKTYKMYSLRRKRSTRECNYPISSVQGVKTSLKKILKLNL